MREKNQYKIMVSILKKYKEYYNFIKNVNVHKKHINDDPAFSRLLTTMIEYPADFIVRYSKHEGYNPINVLKALLLTCLDTYKIANEIYKEIIYNIKK